MELNLLNFIDCYSNLKADALSAMFPFPEDWVRGGVRGRASIIATQLEKSVACFVLGATLGWDTSGLLIY